MFNTRLWVKLLLIMGIWLAIPLITRASQVPIPDPPEGRGGKCVEDEEFMRRNHMSLILHKRNQTMRQGIRTTIHSLKECIGCHAQQRPDGSYIPVNDSGQFCQSCHSYTATKPDCFECHATTPSVSSVPAAN